MQNEIYKLSAFELTNLYKDKALSPVEASKSVLERIKKIDKDINAYVFIDEDKALKEAKESEKRWMDNSPKGKLDGVPTSIKDLLLTKG